MRSWAIPGLLVLSLLASATAPSTARLAAGESSTAHPVIGATSTATDWRCFENGAPLLGRGSKASPPGFRYVEGLSEFALSDRIRLQTVTVAREHEADPSQHIVVRRSMDGGTTWGDWTAVEPEGGRMSSYGGFLRHPATGQVYFIYTYSPERDAKKGLKTRKNKWIRDVPHHIGEAALRYVDDQGALSAERHILALPRAEIDERNVFAGEHLMFYTIPRPSLVIGDDAYAVFIKLGPRAEVNNGALFFARYHDYATNDRLHSLRISLLPASGRGAQAPGSPCVADVAPLALDGDRWLYAFRTTSGYVGFAATNDRGQTLRTDLLRYRPQGRPVKNPEGPLVVSRLPTGVFLAYYNSSHRAKGPAARGARDQVFLSHVRIDGDAVSVSEPELFHYHDDQSGAESTSTRRLNCPRIASASAGFTAQSSDKTAVRRFAIPTAFLEALTGQWTASGEPAQGLTLRLPGPVKEVDAPRLPDLSAGGGWSISFSLKLDSLAAGQVVLDGWQDEGGVRVVLGGDRSLALTMNDGQRTATIASDPDALTAGTLHHITITADGMPALLSMVVDGRLQDGGAARARGTVWFDHAFTTPVAKARWTVGADLLGVVSDVFIHERFLLTSEAVALHRHRSHP